MANSASYTVYLNSINDQKAFATAMEKVQGVRQVKYSNPTREFLTNFGKMLGYASIALIIILLGVGIFLISNTVMIGISVRRHEIKIMKLIGATNSFVRAPFIIEGVTIGLLGSIIPLVIIRLVYDKLIDLIMTKFGVLGNSIPFAVSSSDFFGSCSIRTWNWSRYWFNRINCVNEKALKGIKLIELTGKEIRRK